MQTNYELKTMNIQYCLKKPYDMYLCTIMLTSKQSEILKQPANIQFQKEVSGL